MIQNVDVATVDDAMSSPLMPARYRFGGRRIALLDTDHIFNALGNAVNPEFCERAPGSPLEQSSRCFATVQVLQELYRRDERFDQRHKFDKLAKQFDDRGWSATAGAFREVFEQRYAQRITFVEVGNLFVNHPVVELVRRKDPKDVPTGQLSVLFSRVDPIVYSHNKDLSEPGVAPIEELLTRVLAAGRKVDLSEGAVQGAYGLSAGAVLATNAGLRAAAHALRVPVWLPWLLVSAATGWALLDDDRRSRFVRIAKPIADVVLDQVQSTLENLQLMATAVPRVAPQPDIECRIVAVMVDDDERRGFLASEVRTALRADDAGRVPTESELRRILDVQPFLKKRGYRYYLGGVYGVC
jgi:hypothetical protein